MHLISCLGDSNNISYTTIFQKIVNKLFNVKNKMQRFVNHLKALQTETVYWFSRCIECFPMTDLESLNLVFILFRFNVKRFLQSHGICY